MPTSTHVYTIETGAEPAERVESEVLDLAEALQDHAERRVDRYHGNVTWNPAGTDYYDAFGQTPPPAEIPSPAVVQTCWMDGGRSPEGRLYRRIGGQFVPTDHFEGTVTSLEAVSDYYQTNYGIAPRIGDSTHSPEPVDAPVERRFPWLCGGGTELPAERDRRHAVEWVAGERSSPPGIEPVLSLADADAFFRPVANAIRNSTVRPDDPDVDRLDDGDRAVRAGAVRRIAALGVRDPDRFERFCDAIPRVDEATQRLVAPLLWEPQVLSGRPAPHPATVAPLAYLVDAETPEVRAAAVQGSARILCEALHVLDTDGPSDDLELDALSSPATAFYRAAAAAIEDADPRVRRRAIAVLGELVAGSPDVRPVHPRDDELWERADPEACAAVERALDARRRANDEVLPDWAADDGQ